MLNNVSQGGVAWHLAYLAGQNICDGLAINSIKANANGSSEIGFATELDLPQRTEEDLGSPELLILVLRYYY